MRLKQTLRYLIPDLLKGLGIFYLIIFIIMAFFTIFGATLFTSSSGETVGSYSGVESSAYIFVLIFGIMSFSIPFKMFMQVGISRRTFFTGAMVTFSMMSFIVALMTSLQVIIGKQFDFLDTIFEMVYGGHFAGGSNFNLFLGGFLFNFCLVMFISTISFFSAVLFYRLTKRGRIILGAGLGILLFVLLPMSDLMLFHGILSNAIINFLVFMFGFANNAGNPFYPSAFFAGFALLFSGLSYLVLRRVTLAE